MLILKIQGTIKLMSFSRTCFCCSKQFRIRVNVQLIMHVQIRHRAEDEAEFSSCDVRRVLCRRRTDVVKYVCLKGINLQA